MVWITYIRRYHPLDIIFVWQISLSEFYTYFTNMAEEDV